MPTTSTRSDRSARVHVRAALARSADAVRRALDETLELLNGEASQAERFRWGLRARELAGVLAVLERESGLSVDDEREPERALVKQIAAADELLAARDSCVAEGAARGLKRGDILALREETRRQRDALLAAWDDLRRAERAAWKREQGRAAKRPARSE